MTRTDGGFSRVWFLAGLVAALAVAACGGDPAKAGPTGAGGAAGGGQGGAAGAGTGGEGIGGAGGGGGGVLDSCAKALFCDDFEAQAAGAKPSGKWSVNESKGTVVVDTTRAHSGKNAVRLSTDAATGYKSALIRFKDASVLPTAANVIYGRMMYWLESAPMTAVHWTLIQGVGKVPGQAYSAMYRYGGMQPYVDNGTFVGSTLMANYETPDSYQNPPVGPASDCWLGSDKVVTPVGKWTCVEWKFDGPKNEMHYWMDGAEVPSLAMLGKGQGCVNQDASFPWLSPAFERMDLGWESYQDDDARAIWIDDVVLSEEPIGCP
jgi:hypothetical protein